MIMKMEDIQLLVGLQLGIRQVAPDDRLMEDLGAESSDIVNIIAATEDKYKISLMQLDFSKIRTVQDLYEKIKSFN